MVHSWPPQDTAEAASPGTVPPHHGASRFPCALLSVFRLLQGSSGHTTSWGCHCNSVPSPNSADLDVEHRLDIQACWMESAVHINSAPIRPLLSAAGVLHVERLLLTYSFCTIFQSAVTEAFYPLLWKLSMIKTDIFNTQHLLRLA